ncbi:hypothetical protein Drose_09385 [Dactylosporangium roseum]|uniref:Uncharacterized protein n=1 Tax=Dactylosporangium roseum TaxID=47989 RepID=A0ABY5ZCB6_9ACTN|nr:hypothetical protein [Dactylosporangium roseum]UWZ38427.1 hypothetical protein Drose_09385 [Dactylosporangium roseum]
MTTTSWRHLPPPARAIATAATAAVDATRERDKDAFEAAAEQLGALDAEQVGLVLGIVVRSLLEDLHPDGLDGDDIRAALERAVRSAGEWQDVDPQVMVVLLVGALGVHEQGDDDQRPSPWALARHAPLLVAELLGARSFATYLGNAFTEIERSQIHDI